MAASQHACLTPCQVRANLRGVAGLTAAPAPKRAAVEAAVLRATEELLAEGASYADLSVEEIASARRDLAHRLLLLLPRQARAADAPDRGRHRAALRRGRPLVSRRRRRPRSEIARGAGGSPRSTTSTARCCARSSRSRPTTRRSPRSGAPSIGRFVEATRAAHRGRAGRRRGPPSPPTPRPSRCPG